MCSAETGSVSQHTSLEKLKAESRRVSTPKDIDLVLASACPGPSGQGSNSPVIRRFKNKIALARAIREVERVKDEIEYIPVRERFKDESVEISHSSRHLLEVSRREYGHDFILTRGVSAFVALADVADKTTQVPLDQVDKITDSIIDRGCRALGIDSSPEFDLRSRVSPRRAAVSLSTRW